MVASELVSYASQSVRQCLSSLTDSAKEEKDLDRSVVKEEIVSEKLKKPDSKVRSQLLNLSNPGPTPTLDIYL